MLVLALMAKMMSLALITLACFSACSFKKDDVADKYVQVRAESMPEEESLVIAVRSGSKEEVERFLGEKSSSELEAIVALNGDPLVLVAARRGSVEILELLRGKGLNLWATNKKTGESLLSDISIVTVEADSAVKVYLETSLRKDLDIAKRYFHKGNTAAGLNILSKARIPCTVFTRSMMFMLWANPHIEVAPFMNDLLKQKECVPAKTQVEAQDFLVLELSARLKFGVNHFETLQILSESTNTKIQKFDGNPIVTSNSNNLVRVNLTYSPLALVYLYEKTDPAGQSATAEDINKAASNIVQLIEEPELVLQVAVPEENVATSITYSGVKYQQAELFRFRDYVKLEFNDYAESLSKKYNLQRYSLYPSDERSQ